MTNDLKTAKTALVKLRKDMAAIDRLTKPSSIDLFDQIERTLEPFRRQLEITRTLELTGVADRLSNIHDVNQQWQKMLRQATDTSLNRPGNSGDPLVCIWTPPFMQQYMY